MVRDPKERQRRGIPWLAGAMLLALAFVAALAYWDEERESEAALDDFAREQVLLARSAATLLEQHLASTHEAPSPSALAGLFRGFEHPNELKVLVRAPQDAQLRLLTGEPTAAPALVHAFSGGRSSVWVNPATAASIGLPERTAVAGLARVGSGQGTWDVAVVASAERERDRERRARTRLVLAIWLAASLVLGFGGIALRKQRRELELGQELAVAEIARERDDRLARLSGAATMLTLAAGVAHEVSTPLGVISGRAEQLLARPDADERMRKSAQVIFEQTERIRDVVRGFLDLARGVSPVLHETAPATVVEGALKLVQHRFDEARVKVRTELAHDLPSVHCDPRLLEHALVNLLLNACDAVSANEGEVRITAGVNGDQLSLAVVDNGIGIPAAHAAKVTEPFFTTKPAGKGTGLGLAIATEIAKLHRGTLTIGPHPPRGTRAAVNLPLRGERHG